jgi:triacylglycerol lipase
MNVVLVHGFLDRGGIFRRMARRLTERGHTCYLPSLRPSDARKGLPDLAEKLAAYLAAEVDPVRNPTALVGFSMGSIISRYYLQEMGGIETTRAFFAISGPHRGTWNAVLYPSKGAWQMRPGSPLLKQLAASADLLKRIPTYSYWTPFDVMILPPTSCCLPGSEQLRVWTPIHALMPSSRRIADHIGEELAKLK